MVTGMAAVTVMAVTTRLNRERSHYTKEFQVFFIIKTMFLFRHKIKLIDSDFFHDFVDFHSHILPGVDDGVKTVDEALEILGFLESLKIGKVIFTPHIISGMPNDLENIRRVYDFFCKEYNGKIELGLGAEYMLDLGFQQRIKEGLQYIDGNKVLVETYSISSTSNLYEQLFDLSVTGNTPVIAHPERYVYMRHADYHKLKNRDCLFQLNLLSLAGYYGKQVVRNAEYLLEQGMYDVIGTDLHSLEVFKTWIKRLKITNLQLNMLLRINERIISSDDVNFIK